MKPEIMTTSGSYFDFLDPDPDSFTIEDIAYALSNTCRYGGHCKPFYSVAQHCVYVSREVPEEFALHALLHDAHEAFVGDIPSPLKRLLPDFRKIEDIAEEVVLRKFNVHDSTESHRVVKAADLVALRTEREVLLPPGEEGDAWWWVVTDGIEVSDQKIEPVSPNKAYLQFLKRFEEIMEEMWYEEAVELQSC